jgi:hypothetical protein
MYQKQAKDTLNLVNTVMRYKAKEAYINAVNKAAEIANKNEKGLSYKPDRTAVEGYNKSVSGKAVQAERDNLNTAFERYSKLLGKNNVPDIAKFRKMMYTNNKEFQILSEKYKDKIIQSNFSEIEYLTATLDNATVRKWYKLHDEGIPNQIDKTLPLEEQAKKACELRNTYRTQARDLMKDQESRKVLDQNDPNKTFEELLADKMKRKNLTREQAVADILKTAVKTNRNVNKFFGLE